MIEWCYHDSRVKYSCWINLFMLIDIRRNISWAEFSPWLLPSLQGYRPNPDIRDLLDSSSNLLRFGDVLPHEEERDDHLASDRGKLPRLHELGRQPRHLHASLGQIPRRFPPRHTLRRQRARRRCTNSHASPRTNGAAESSSTPRRRGIAGTRSLQWRFGSWQIGRWWSRRRRRRWRRRRRSSIDFVGERRGKVVVQVDVSHSSAQLRARTKQLWNNTRDFFRDFDGKTKQKDQRGEFAFYMIWIMI